MGAPQHPIIAGQKLAPGLDLGLGALPVVFARCVAQIPLWPNHPIAPDPVLAQLFVGKAAPDRTFGPHDEGLLEPLVLQLVQRNEHQGS
ncbi:hypothetical protein G6F59_017854 [Rhizopus arrhizus]|nr:hypothetical protein G6F59_017854 [Rhizopus arrhizus]